ncbi:MAG: hypothetical protein RL385_320 [Pseudomonadota bacterium]|jgi:hypothetical protein
MSKIQAQYYVSSGNGELRATLEIHDDHRVIRSAHKAFSVHGADSEVASDFELVSVSTLVGAPIIAKQDRSVECTQKGPFLFSQRDLSKPLSSNHRGPSGSEAAFAYEFSYRDLIVRGPTLPCAGPAHRLFSAFIAGSDLYFEFKLRGERRAASLRLRIDNVVDKRPGVDERVPGTQPDPGSTVARHAADCGE